MFSRIILIILTLIAVGLYIRVILPPDNATSLDREQSAQVTPPQEQRVPAEPSAPAVASNAATSSDAAPAKDTASPEKDASTLEPLPAEQMRLVLETLAPELMPKKP